MEKDNAVHILPITEGMRLVMKSRGIMGWHQGNDQFPCIFTEYARERNSVLFDIIIEAIDNGEEMYLAQWANETQIYLSGLTSLVSHNLNFWKSETWNTGKEYEDALNIISQSKYAHPRCKELAGEILAEIEKGKGEGYIYVAKGGVVKDGRSYCKIGTSLNSEHRIASFSPKLPFPVEVVISALVTKRYQVEAKLHKHFANQRTNGEWFNLSEEDLDWIRQEIENNAIETSQERPER